MDLNNRVLVVAIYSHPEYYPPTLSALENLALLYKKIYVLHGNTKGFDWKYPDNVILVGSGTQYEPAEVEAGSVRKKIGWFIHFSRTFYALVTEQKPDTILLYDFMPILSYRLISGFIRKPGILWYHNHDVADENHIRKYSLSWFAWKSEKWIFPKLNIFSLPAVERKTAFPMNLLKGNFIFLPNFPSIHIYKYQELKKDAPGKTIKLLFQGSIGTLHGLEEMIPLLREQFNGHNLQLILKGFISKEYSETLHKLAGSYAVADRVIFIGPTGYADVIENSKTCDIGIGIHMKQDIMNRTLGTASNKIYEYAATGLPVLIYDNEHFRQTLGKYSWVFFTDVSESSLRNCLQEIVSNMSSLSKAALKDFDNFSYEQYFKPVAAALSV
jgi:glycosyltransferase involved in cell wall biosynthesis